MRTASTRTMVITTHQAATRWTASQGKPHRTPRTSRIDPDSDGVGQLRPHTLDWRIHSKPRPVHKSRYCPRTGMSTPEIGYRKRMPIEKNIPIDLLVCYRLAWHPTSGATYCTVTARILLFLGARWKQQKLPAWQPVYRPVNVIGTFVGFGALLVAIGVFMLVTTSKVPYLIHQNICLPSK